MSWKRHSPAQGRGSVLRRSRPRKLRRERLQLAEEVGHLRSWPEQGRGRGSVHRLNKVVEAPFADKAGLSLSVSGPSERATERRVDQEAAQRMPTVATCRRSRTFSSSSCVLASCSAGGRCPACRISICPCAWLKQIRRWALAPVVTPARPPCRCHRRGSS